MHAVDLLDAPTVHHAVIAHFLAAAAAFFGGLEDHHNGTVEIAGLGEILRRAQQHRSVAIMAAGVHGVCGLGGILQTGFFVDRQRVHIGAQPDDLASRVGFALDHAYNAGAANARDHFVAAEFLELFLDQRAGAVGLKQDFRVFVQIASPRGDLCLKFGKTVFDGHGSFSLSIEIGHPARQAVARGLNLRPLKTQLAGIRRSQSSTNQLQPSGMALSSN